MNNASTITGCTHEGVQVYGTFTMNGGSINSNGEGGVNVGSPTKENAIFIMNGGIIENNKATNGGGGVSIWSGTFTMKDGRIQKNKTSKDGGGVYVSHGDFYMTGGTIYGSNRGSYANKAGWRGDAVYDNNKVFKARNRTIYQH